MTASSPSSGVATFVIELLAISKEFLTVVVPLTSRRVAGVVVFIPILPVLSPKRAFHVPPGVPAGGLANVHAHISMDKKRISAKTLFGILISIARHTTL